LLSPDGEEERTLRMNALLGCETSKYTKHERDCCSRTNERDGM
jgi:hypothetical protein